MMNGPGAIPEPQTLEEAERVRYGSATPRCADTDVLHSSWYKGCILKERRKIFRRLRKLYKNCRDHRRAGNWLTISYEAKTRKFVSSAR